MMRMRMMKKRMMMTMMLPGDQISLISARYGSASNNDEDEKSYSDVDYVWSPKLQQVLANAKGAYKT